MLDAMSERGLNKPHMPVVASNGARHVGVKANSEPADQPAPDMA